jgi:hypothetical protein
MFHKNVSLFDVMSDQHTDGWTHGHIDTIDLAFLIKQGKQGTKSIENGALNVTLLHNK